jgi:hypothetical protein
MSLHNIVAGKKGINYRCIKSVDDFTKDMGSSICGTFHIGWEYQTSYVESRVPEFLISKYFKKIEN